jgi:hypothetical protein
MGGRHSSLATLELWLPLRAFLPLLSPRGILWALMLLVPFALGGCGTLGLGASPTPSPSASPGPVSGAGWIVVASGSPTARPALPRGSASPALSPVSFLPVDRSCTPSWDLAAVQIPLTVTAGAGKLTVSWPRLWDSGYRIAAVPQPLVFGDQSTPTWQTVPSGTGCAVAATISGLRSGTPYVVWLDAPGTAAESDGSRHPYSGSSGVVYPL